MIEEDKTMADIVEMLRHEAKTWCDLMRARHDIELDPADLLSSRAAAEITRLHALLSAYEARLEIDHAWRLVDGKLTRFEIPPEDRPNWPDGITCRDETIKLLEEQLGRARQRHDGE
jgi:hypothetical protein